MAVSKIRVVIRGTPSQPERVLFPCIGCLYVQLLGQNIQFFSHFRNGKVACVLLHRALYERNAHQCLPPRKDYRVGQTAVEGDPAVACGLLLVQLREEFLEVRPTERNVILILKRFLTALAAAH